jgi:cyclohexanone monooxygenase
MKPQAQQMQPDPSATKHRIVIVGAGPGGICMAIKLKQAGVEDFVILERAAGAGGTWFNNRYPGLSCDIPSHLYSFSFEQKSDWSRPYAGHAEIRAYMQHCVDKYGLAPHIRFNCGIASARWDDARREWWLDTSEGQRVVAEVFISALGMFNEIQWPDIAGLKDFKGPLLHTALWPEGVDLRGKTVAVIGSAASAVQLVPEVAKEAKQLDLYQRTANWVLPKEDKPYSAEQLQQMRDDPAIGRKIRDEQFAFYELLLLFDKPEMMKDVKKMALDNLNTVVDPVTRAKMLPNVPLGSQRPLFSNDFYPTFNRPNVALVTEPIERVTATGVKTADGVERKVDVVILATGYAANKFLSVIDVSGRDGLRLNDAWRDGPQAYLGITVAGFPNLFMFYGPNTNNGSILHMLECQADYIARKIAEMSANDIRAMEVRQAVMDDYNVAIQRAINTVEAWRVVGTKYYRSASGRVVTQWPHDMTTYRERTSAPDMEAFDILSA